MTELYGGASTADDYLSTFFDVDALTRRESNPPSPAGPRYHMARAGGILIILPERELRQSLKDLERFERTADLLDLPPDDELHYRSGPSVEAGEYLSHAKHLTRLLWSLADPRRGRSQPALKREYEPLAQHRPHEWNHAARRARDRDRRARQPMSTRGVPGRTHRPPAVCMDIL